MIILRVRLLLKNGAKVNDVTNNSAIPLNIAAWANCPETVKVLLSYKPDLEILDTGADLALSAATYYGNTEVIRLLREAGANINHRSALNAFPLQMAVKQNLENVLPILMDYNPKVNLVDNHGNTALHCMQSYTSVTIAKVLVNGGADPNIRNKEQETPICRAVWSNNWEILKYLAKKAEIDIVGGKHGGPLHIACYQSNLHLVKMLVDAGADVNLFDPVIETPLQSGCGCSKRSSKEDQESISSTKLTWTLTSLVAYVVVPSTQLAVG